MTPDAREQARHKASVMIAFAEGKEIEVSFGHDHWMTCKEPPGWDWRACRYRVKPEERKPWQIALTILEGQIHGVSRSPDIPDGSYIFREVIPETETE